MKTLFTVYCLLFTVGMFAQEVVRSEKIATIDGKMYYVHTVVQGETLYSIAKGYDVSVKNIVENNGDVLDGLKAGQEIKIPCSEVKRDPAIVKQEEKNPKWKI